MRLLISILKNGKTVTGSTITLIVFILSQMGISTNATEVGQIVGAGTIAIGLIHKIIKLITSKK
jgi:hypothetical protein